MAGYRLGRARHRSHNVEVAQEWPLSERPLLSPQQCVDLGYFVSVAAAASMRCRGVGPRYAKLGKKIMYRKEDLDAWIQQNITGP